MTGENSKTPEEVAKMVVAQGNKLYLKHEDREIIAVDIQTEEGRNLQKLIDQCGTRLVINHLEYNLYYVNPQKNMLLEIDELGNKFYHEYSATVGRKKEELNKMIRQSSLMELFSYRLK